MTNMTPRLPQSRVLLWSDSILDLQETLHGKIADDLYIVGGAVRDAFLHHPIKDLDLATPGDAIRIAKTIANAMKGDVYVLDAERGVARAMIDTADGRLVIDVARYRGADLLADLEGRDFTINAMAVDMRGDLNLLIDPLNGEQDATIKVVRRCTAQSLPDDPIRGLRAVRQSVQLGFKIEPLTQADIRTYAAKLTETSPERLRDEFFDLLSSPRVRMALRVADTLGLVEPIVPEIALLHGVDLPPPYIFNTYDHTLAAVEAMAAIVEIISYKRTDNSGASFGMGMLAIQFDRFRKELNEHVKTEWSDGRTHRAILVLGALLHAVGLVTGNNTAEIAAERADAMRLSTHEKKRLAGMIAHFEHAVTIDATSSLALHRYWYPLRTVGVDACLLGLAVYLATYGNEIRQDEWLIQVERAVLLLQAYFLFHDTLVVPPAIINGNELMDELQLESGPIVGQLTTLIREGQVTGAINTRVEALAAARQYLDSH
jgi:tRNA nucleotidyltransferase/poly(A) polymerase